MRYDDYKGSNKKNSNKKISYADYTGPNKYFINPYNFVSVNFNGELQRQDISERKDEELKHTGVFRCRMITKTPLCVPDIETGVTEANGHKKYDFMRTPEGHPFIPGSSIRGSVRNMYEALTNSCLSTVDESKSITYRTKKAFFPGLLRINDSETKKYELYKADRYIFKVVGYKPYQNAVYSKQQSDLKKLKYGAKVFVKGDRRFTTGRGFRTSSILIDKLSDTEEKGLTPGYICIGEPFSRKHFESVFVKAGILDGVNQDELQKAVGVLDEIVRIYNDEKINIKASEDNKFYEGRNYKGLAPNKYYPIWYMIVGNKVYLSVANIGRTAYSNKMGDKLKDYKVCKKRKALCPACRLFGMAEEEAIASRVRFSDALLCGDSTYGKKTILKELAGPKSSYLPFYLKKPNNGEWSYDNSGCELRGRKFYWHNLKENVAVEPKGEKTKRNASMELIKEGREFTFSVFYNDLSEAEWKQLIWTITLGENVKDGNLCYKIGHGKPIGLGSVKLIIEQCEERSFDHESGKYVLHRDNNVSIDDREVSFDKGALDQIRIITDVTACKGVVVDYPGIVDDRGVKYTNGDNSVASHKWFSENFTLGRDPKKSLPEIHRGVSNQDLVWKKIIT